MKKILFLSILLVIVVLAACSEQRPSEGAIEKATRTLELVPGNPTCQDLGYAYQFKPQQSSGGDATGNGIYVNSDGVTIEITGVTGTATPPFSWTATLDGEPFGIDAVISKGGPAANVYHYNPEVSSDTGLLTPVNASGNPAGISHFSFCYDFEVIVKKDAKTSFDRDWTWDIDKVGDADALTLSAGGSYVVNYDVTVSATSADSNWAVTGTITIKNPDPGNSATITGVSDVISPDIVATVDCGVPFPITISSGGTHQCTYSANLPDATDRINTATATTSGVVGGDSGTAAVSFASATIKETDECIAVTDDKFGDLGTVCANQLPKTFEYSLTVVAPATCGTSETFVNIATFTTNDTGATGSDDHTIVVTVPPCNVGCTLTQGYWKTHSSYGPAREDDGWAAVGGPDASFFLSGRTWYQVFWTAPAGNVYYNLAHQYMAAKLNILNGAATTPAVTAAITSAEALLSSKTPAQAATLKGTAKAAWTAAAGTLGQYNEGLIGPGHCDE